MKQGYLSEYFAGVAAKMLTATEIDPQTSRGHEYQGVDTFRAFLGTPSEKQKIPVTYVWLTDDGAPEKLELTGTWYDSRSKQRHRDPEYRLYYPVAAEEVVYRARAGDILLFCLPRQGPLLALSCPSESTIAESLLWLFNLNRTAEFSNNQRDLRNERGAELDFTARYILDLIEIDVALTEDEWLDRLVHKFGSTFPPTGEFSEFARKQLPEADPIGSPDETLLAWIEFEERLFPTLEKHIVGIRLLNGFIQDGVADIDAFVGYSLSVQNRRKARAGSALENHIATILEQNKIQFSRGSITETRNRPDFLFPSAQAYLNNQFPSTRLTMLGVKSTCKDRWRQVLSEADRIPRKHLLTLEPSISENQTNEMKGKLLQLVLPKRLHETYRPAQRDWLMTLEDFIRLVRQRQELSLA